MAQKPQTADRRKLISAAREAGRHLPTPLPPAIFLTDPDRTPHPERIAKRLPRGWAVLYRHFGAADRLAVATRLAKIARQRQLTLLIAADPLLAMEVGAGGIHWPFAMRHQARKWQGRFRLMTVSTHGGAELRRVSPDVFDAALVSAVFPSKSPSAGKPVGPGTLRTLARVSDLPIYALGGVTANTAQQISRTAGLASIEGISDVFGDQNL